MLKAILLYSKESPANTVRVVQGHSGKTYGHARFNPTEGRMECRFKPEEFTQAIAEDIVANMHRSFCKWVFWPEMDTADDKPVESHEEEPIPKEQPAAESTEPTPSPLDALPPAAEEVPETKPAAESAPAVDPYAGKNFRQLRAMAKERGVQNIELFTKSVELIDAMKALEG